MEMPWGKYRGEDLEDIPDDYLTWVLDNCERISPTLRRAIEIRLGLARDPPRPPPSSSPHPSSGGNATARDTLDRVIRAWHRMMTMKYHPDRGGKVDHMQLVNEGAELLRKLQNDLLG